MTMVADIMAIETSAIEPQAGQTLIRLMSWLSPSFPTGAFSYSHGLEFAVHGGLVTGRPDLNRWIAALLTHGTAWNDCVLFAESWRLAQSNDDLCDLSELAEAMTGSSERHLETTAQGAAFLAAAREWPHPGMDRLPDGCALPVAVGALTGLHKIPLQSAIAAYLHGFSNNLVQAGLRLLPLGQQAGVKTLHDLEDCIIRTADRAAASSLDDLGNAAILSEIVAIRHETQNSRIFRS